MEYYNSLSCYTSVRSIKWAPRVKISAMKYCKNYLRIHQVGDNRKHHNPQLNVNMMTPACDISHQHSQGHSQSYTN